MRQLLPFPADDVTPYDVYGVDQPTRLVRINMVASVDGRTTDAEGRAGGLGGDGDFEVFRALRALADGILVGAGTVRTEGYGPHKLPRALAERRRRDGVDAPATVIVVSRSLNLDLRSRLFADAVARTIVLTCDSSPTNRRDALSEVARVVVAGDNVVDLADGLAQLAEDHGIARVVCEGGASLNQALLGAGLADELCLTIAPQLVGSEGVRLVNPPVPSAGLELRGACEQNGELYLRYGITGR
jgi:riboflavin-specific deaminase-like protein